MVDRRDALYQLLYKKLQELARAGKTATYTDIAHFLGLDPMDRSQMGLLGEYLHEINRQEHDSERPPLSTLVVGRDGIPGEGYFDSLFRLCIIDERPMNKKEKKTIWITMSRRVSDYWSRAYETSTEKIESPKVESSSENVRRFVEDKLLKTLPENQSTVLRMRYGLWDGNQEGLSSISKSTKRSRERIRQIQGTAERKLRDNPILRGRVDGLLGRFRVVTHNTLLSRREGLAGFSELDEEIYALGEDVQTMRLAYNFLKRIYFPTQNPLTKGLLPCGKEALAMTTKIREKFENVVKATESTLSVKKQPLIPEELGPFISKRLGQPIPVPFIKRCAELSDQIGLDDAGRVGLKRWPYFTPQTIDQMAYSALMDIGEPSHFNHIVSEMNVRFPKRAPFKVRTVHNSLVAKPRLFVSLGQGIWGLKEWGAKVSLSV